MKTKLTLFMLFISVTLIAQNGINYKTLIKDGSGNIVANQSVTIQFIILEDTSNVYQETHSTTTDNNGIAIVNIGEGTTSDVFLDINWANDEHFLNVQVDLGSGYVDMGTTAFKSVPYAISSNDSYWEKVDNSSNIFYSNDIGIGTASIDAKVDIFANGSLHYPQLSIHENGNDYARIAYKNTNAERLWTTAAYINPNILNDRFSIANSDSGDLLIITGDGNVGISDLSPDAKLQILDGNDASLTNNTGYIVLGSSTSQNLALDTNEIMARNNGNVSTLFVQNDGGSTNFGGSIYLNGILLHSSDKRLKRNIEDLDYGLEEILQLIPKQYLWKNKEQTKNSLGLIAQDVKQVISEIVTQRDNEQKTLGVNYIELIPVLIKAIQEQQEIIIKQNSKIENLTINSNQKDDILKIFEKRLMQIEALLNK